MNVVKEVDAVEIRLDARISILCSLISWEELTTSGCSLILHFFERCADGAHGWAKANWATSRNAGSKKIMMKWTLGFMMGYFRKA